MQWGYIQSTGDLTFNRSRVATGYSGHTNGKNKPHMEHVRNVGPIPRGEYKIETPRNSARTGSFVLPLTPVGHNALGRTDFQIHGDSRSNLSFASNGCIILNRSIREKIWQSGIRKLVVKK